MSLALPSVTNPAYPGAALAPASRSVSSAEGGPAEPGARRLEQSQTQRAEDKRALLAEQKQIQQLAQRDREVRAHEQAHAAVGGRYAGAPTYDYQRGPNGRQYAVGGEVKIDIAKVEGDPQATLEKAQIVRRAALAPAEPSAQDRAVAARASQMAAEARAEIATQRLDPETAAGVAESDSAQQTNNSDTSQGAEIGDNSTQRSGVVSVSAVPEPGTLIDVVA